MIVVFLVNRTKRPHCEKASASITTRLFRDSMELLYAVMQMQSLRHNPMTNDDIPDDLLSLVNDPKNHV